MNEPTVEETLYITFENLNQNSVSRVWSPRCCAVHLRGCWTALCDVTLKWLMWEACRWSTSVKRTNSDFFIPWLSINTLSYCRYYNKWLWLEGMQLRPKTVNQIVHLLDCVLLTPTPYNNAKTVIIVVQCDRNYAILMCSCPVAEAVGCLPSSLNHNKWILHIVL